MMKRHVKGVESGTLVSKGSVESSSGVRLETVSRGTLIRQLEVNSRSHVLRNPTIDRPMRRLAAAVLAQALKDALGVGGGGPRSQDSSWQRDALSWFASDEDSPGSMRWVSEVVDIDAESIRKWVSLHAGDSTEGQRSKGPFASWRRF